MTTSEEIKRRLWDGADKLRGTMDASRYKDYMLGLMFYKFLSDKTLQTFKETAGLPDNANVLEEYWKAHEEYGEELEKVIQQILGYQVTPEHLYQTWEEDIKNGDFELSEVMDSLNAFERSIAATDDSDDFKGLFSSSVIDLTNTALGSDLSKRSKNIRDLIGLFADFNMVALQNGDVLGDAYEYLIGQFAESGKKAGEFYTPTQVSEIIAQIIARTTEIKSIYDPTVGSGSLLLTVGKHLSKDARKNLRYYGQEYNTATYNLTRMNLLLHDVRPENMTIRNGNTMAIDWPEDPSRPGEGVQFDAVVMNPPYSDKNWNKHEDKPLKVSDPRFSEFGALPPESKGDFAYLMHGLYHLGQQGTMGIVLPHGVLFRGDTEGEIRKRLIEKNYIDAIIGLPSNLFTNTGIPVAILILKKNRKLTDPVLIIDASHDFIKAKNNVLRERDTAKIVDTYINKQELRGYSHLASRQEIIDNDYNLNIPRYVDSIDEEIPEDVDGHLLGGIPEKNLDHLSVLSSTTKKLLADSLEQVRPGYVKLKVTVDDLKKQALSDENIIEEQAQLREVVKTYINKYNPELKQINKDTNLAELKLSMVDEIKNILSQFANLDQYAGYQIVADLWKSSLEKDAELIAANGFYEAGRTRKPNMVEKGSGAKKRTVQDGWIGAIVPNDLIADVLYQDEKFKIGELEQKTSNIESELGELVEAAKTEDTPEYDFLFDVLKKNDEGEPQDSFESKKVKAALKESEEGSSKADYLTRVSKLMPAKAETNREIKNAKADLQEAIYARIEKLSDEEIDQLMQKKWFGGFEEKIVKLVTQPLLADLQILKMLDDRYADTLDDIDAQISRAEMDLNSLMQDLVLDNEQ